VLWIVRAFFAFAFFGNAFQLWRSISQGFATFGHFFGRRLVVLRATNPIGFWLATSMHAVVIVGVVIVVWGNAELSQLVWH
jgi:hypothetical protein